MVREVQVRVLLAYPEGTRAKGATSRWRGPGRALISTRFSSGRTPTDLFVFGPGPLLDHLICDHARLGLFRSPLYGARGGERKRGEKENEIAVVGHTTDLAHGEVSADLGNFLLATANITPVVRNDKNNIVLVR